MPMTLTQLSDLSVPTHSASHVALPASAHGHAHAWVVPRPLGPQPWGRGCRIEAEFSRQSRSRQKPLNRAV